VTAGATAPLCAYCGVRPAARNAGVKYTVKYRQYCGDTCLIRAGRVAPPPGQPRYLPPLVWRPTAGGAA